MIWLGLGLAALTLAIICSLWIIHVVRMLGLLERSIESFGNGTPGDDLGNCMDFMTPPGKILHRIFDLAREMADRNRQLEEVITVHTMELELRNVILSAVTGPLDDAAAYARVVHELAVRFNAGESFFAYFNGAEELVGAAVGSGPSGVLGGEVEKILEEAVAGSPPPWFAPDVVVHALRLESEGELVGYVVLGRKGRPFLIYEAGLFGSVFALFAAPVLTRKLHAREELIRLRAEESLSRSEKELQTFFDKSGDMIYSSNADDTVSSINAAGLALLGVKDRLDVVGQPFSKFVLSPEDRQFFLSKIGKEDSLDGYEIVLKKEDGTVVFCIETARAVKNEDGRTVEVQGIVKDISERIERERELWKTNMELAEANSELTRTQNLMVQREKLASIGQLAAGVAHEINNPLGFLKSNQETLASYLNTMRKAWEEAAALDPAAHADIAKRLDLAYISQESVNMIRESDEGFSRIVDIVRNLRTFSRQDDDAAKGPYDLNEGIESTLIIAKNEIKYVADIELKLGALPLIRATGGEINQVLLNILVNSAQAIESQKRKAKGRIFIETRLEGDRAVLVISDDGPGIPEEIRLRVFDPFFTTKEPGKGTGLGLSISYDIIVRKHGGSIIVSTSPQGGAQFRIELPVAGIGQPKEVGE